MEPHSENEEKRLDFLAGFAPSRTQDAAAHSSEAIDFWAVQATLLVEDAPLQDPPIDIKTVKWAWHAFRASVLSVITLDSMHCMPSRPERIFTAWLVEVGDMNLYLRWFKWQKAGIRCTEISRRTPSKRTYGLIENRSALR
jgi:hypothetical protein